MKKRGIKLIALLLAAALCFGCLAESGLATDNAGASETEAVSGEITEAGPAGEIMALDAGEEGILQTYGEADTQTGESGGASSTEQTTVPDLATPALSEISHAASGVKITWKAVSGAEGYAVFRKTSGGRWKRIATTTSTSYTDKSSLSNGKTYYYTVRAYRGSQSTALNNTYSSSYWSSYDSAGAKAVYTKEPTLSTSVTNTTSGIKVSWSKVSGANGYAVFRKTKSGSWSTIGTTTSTSYTDTTAKAGTTYYYTARAYRGSESTALANTYDAQYWSGYKSSGVSGRFLATPTLNSAASATSSGIKVSWSKVSGASGYAVYRKQSGGSWKRIATTTSTSYTDKSSLTDGKTYYYTVRAYRGSKSTALKHTYSSTYWSSYDSAGVKIVYMKAPTLKSAVRSTDGVKVSWGSLSGAKGYAVFRKVSGGSWSRLGTTTSTSYTDTTAKEGTAYIYTVRAYRGDETTALANTYNAQYWSVYSSSGCSTEGGIVKDGSKYYYVDGSGTKVTSKEIQLAVDFVVAHSTEGASNSTRLEECYNYLWNHYSYKRYYNESPSASKMAGYAKDMFNDKCGNCYRYAASFACIAKVLGYDSRVVVGNINNRNGTKSPHGLTEVKVDGTWYMCDPCMQRSYPNKNSYLRTSSKYPFSFTRSKSYTLSCSKGKATWK